MGYGIDLKSIQNLKQQYNNGQLIEQQFNSEVDRLIEKYFLLAEKKQFLLTKNYQSFEVLGVESGYYQKSLEERKEILKAPDINYLCKTLVMENTAFNPDLECEIYQKVFCVIIQYNSKMSTQNLEKFFKKYQNENCVKQAQKKDIHFRFLESQESLQLTGYGNGSVTPFQMKTRMNVIISEPIIKLGFFWLGGGHLDIKIRVSVDEFLSKYESKIIIGKGIIQ